MMFIPMFWVGFVAGVVVGALIVVVFIFFAAVASKTKKPYKPNK